jgi:flagellar hook-length control protein FliK
MDTAFADALDAVATEESAPAGSHEAGPADAAAKPETIATPARPAAPPPARGAVARAGAQPAPTLDAIASSSLTSGGAVASTAPSVDPSSQAQGATLAPATPAPGPASSEPAVRSEAAGRGAAIVAAAAHDAPQASADGPGFGDGSADASTGEAFAPAASPARAASPAGRTLEAAPAGEAVAAASPAVGSTALGQVAVSPDVQPLARAFETPVPPIRFEHTLATVDPDTRNLQAMVRTVRLFTDGQGTGEARLQLEPDHLGPVALTVRVEQGTVSAHFRAETPAAQRWIETHQHELRAGLRDQGLEVKEVVVTTDPDGRRERQADPQPRRPRARRADAGTPRFEVIV